MSSSNIETIAEEIYLESTQPLSAEEFQSRKQAMQAWLQSRLVSMSAAAAQRDLVGAREYRVQAEHVLAQLQLFEAYVRVEGQPRAGG